MISSALLPPANATESVDTLYKPAVHSDRNARNVARALGGKKHHQVGELLRRAEASHGDLARPSSADLAGLDALRRCELRRQFIQPGGQRVTGDRKSTRLNSSHTVIS